MKCFIELWKAKDAWLKLPKKEREEYLAQIGPSMQEMVEKGVEFGAWGENDPETARRLGYDYFGIWSFPTDELAKEFEQLVEAAGWYNYMDQVNISGKACSPMEIIGKMAEL